MESIEKLYNRIRQLIDDHRFFDAMNLIRQYDLTGECRDLLAESATAYKYMLHYFAKSVPGSVDNARPAIVSQTRESLLRANDRLKVARLEVSDSSAFYTARRNAKVRNGKSINSVLQEVQTAVDKYKVVEETDTYNMQLRREVDAAIDCCFGQVWSTLHLDKGDITALRQFFNHREDSQLYYIAQSQVLNAMLLSSLMYYDSAKLELMLEVALDKELHHISVRARALCASLLLLAKYADRVSSPYISSRTQVLLESEELSAAVRKFVLLMLRTIDTDRVNKRVKEEIFPELMRLKPDIEKSMRRMEDKFSNMEVDENPAWEELLDKSGVSDKLKELTDMQMDGADIFMSAFSQMKVFPFFRPLSHWLLPFDINHSEIKQVSGMVPPTLLAMLNKGNYFCSSDKYSMVLALSKMPPEQFKMMSGQLAEQMNTMQEDIATSMLGVTTDIATEMSQYLKDLYRFFRLKNESIDDPFGGVFELPSVEPFASLLSDIKLLRSMAEFYFKYGYWEQAEKLFMKIGDIESNAQEDLLQKQGYCLQMLGRDSDALECYKRAELLNPDSDWLLKRISQLLRSGKRYEEAAEYASRALTKSPDNLSLEMLLGTSLMLDGKAKDALKSFYKIRYLKPDNTKVLRPIAWCEFLLGNYDKSINIYNNMPELRAEDMLNCGHAFLSKGDIAAAVSMYQRCMGALEQGVDQFRVLMKDDTPYLLQAGVEPLTVILVTELVTASSSDLAV